MDELAAPRAVIDKDFVNISLYPHDALAASQPWLDAQDFDLNEPVRAINVRTGASASLRIVILPDVEPGNVRLSRRMRTALSLEAGDEVDVKSESVLCYDGVALQAASETGTSTVQIPAKDLNLLDRSCPYQRLICCGSGNELIVRTEDVEGYATADDRPGPIKLDRYQRKLLGLEAPQELSAEKLELFLADADDDSRALVEQAYPGGLLSQELSHTEKSKVYGVLRKGGFGRIHIAALRQYDGDAQAVASSDNVRPARQKRGPGQAICDFFLRASSMTLTCVRPYDLDEGRAVVRISPDTMALLGVDEGDSVRLRYGSVVGRARVLCLDNETEISQTNLLGENASFDNLVGIPASLRNQLGINSLHTSVVVERDTTFLFKKHLNIQFFSIIAMLFTVWQTVEVFDIDPLHATIAFFVLLPFVIYLILSEERMRVQKLK